MASNWSITTAMMAAGLATAAMPSERHYYPAPKPTLGQIKDRAKILKKRAINKSNRKRVKG